MPTYGYECTKCNHRFDVFQKMNDKAVEKCPKCGKKVKRQITSGAGVIFKGTGFYATDYKKTTAPPNPPTCPNKKQGGCSSCPAANG